MSTSQEDTMTDPHTLVAHLVKTANRMKLQLEDEAGATQVRDIVDLADELRQTVADRDGRTELDATEATRVGVLLAPVDRLTIDAVLGDAERFDELVHVVADDPISLTSETLASLYEDDHSRRNLVVALHPATMVAAAAQTAKAAKQG